MNENNESVLQSFKQFLQTYDSGKSGLNVKSSPLTDPLTADVADLSSHEIQTVVLRSRTATDSCLFSEHTISPNDVEPEVFDWIFYHLDYKKCPHPLAFALASIVSRKLGLAETTRESHNSDADKSKPAISSNELYSQSLEYLTEYINSWKENPEIAVEIAKEYSSKTFVSSICAIKNARRKMEDRHVVLPDLNKALALKTPKQYSYYAIFDGHAGVDAASYASAHLHYHLVKSQAFIDGDIVAAFKDAFSITDLHYLERSAREGKKSGSTALCAIIEDNTNIYVAWLGDSMAVLVKNGKPIDIMIPHKPELKEERDRIEKLGGFVAYVDTWRVNGTLAVSRAIGDPEHKPYIISEPDVVQLVVNSETDFLILACDGLWDQLTPEEATSLVYEYICENGDQNIDEISRNVATHLSKIAKDDGSSDNITTIVIFFKDLEQLRATPFTPLTPREKNETNGLNGNHFQYNDFEFTQSNAKNPFDSTSDPPFSWSTDSAFDELNNAKLNFEVSDSINSSENSTNEMKGISNPFSSNDYSYADLNNANKPFDSSLDNNNYFNNESSLLKEPTNSFEINDKLESDTSQTIANDCSNELQSLHSDSQFNISKLSDISSSFPTQAVIHTDHALCSTPIQTSEPFFIESNGQQKSLLETNMDSTDGTQESHSFVQFISGSGDDPRGGLDTTIGSFADYSKESFGSAKSDFDDSNSFNRTGYQTAYEQDFAQHLNDSNETPIQTPIKLEEVCEQVFSDIDDPNATFNQNQDIHDLSSGAESVDSFCYEKIGSDLSKISEKVANDFQLQQIYGSIPIDSQQQIQTEELKQEIINNVVDIEIKTDSELNQTNLITEALMAEHMSPEEAEEVAKQLIVEQSYDTPTQEVIEENIEQQIGSVIEDTEDIIKTNENLFESNQFETQHKTEEIIFQPLSEDLLPETKSEELKSESTQSEDTFNDFRPEISSEVSDNTLQESCPESILDFPSGLQLSSEDIEAKPLTDEPIAQISEQFPQIDNFVAESKIPLETSFDELIPEVKPKTEPEIETEDTLDFNNQESIVDQLVTEEIKCDFNTEESIVSTKEMITDLYNESLTPQFENLELKSEVNTTEPLTPVETLNETFELNNETNAVHSTSYYDPNESILNFEPLSDNQSYNGFVINSSEDNKSEPIPEPTIETYSNGLAETESMIEETVLPTQFVANPESISLAFETESQLKTEFSTVEEIKSESVLEVTPPVAEENLVINDNLLLSDITAVQTEPQIPIESLVTEEIKPKEIVKEVTKTTKGLTSTVGLSKTSKPLTKTDPKSKTTSNTPAKTQSKPLANKVTTTSRVATKQAPTATTKPTSGLTAKTTTSKPLAEKTALKASSTTTTAKRTTNTTTSRLNTTSAASKPSITAKTQTSRLNSASSTVGAKSAPMVGLKPSTKPVPTRAPITARTATTSTASARTARTTSATTTTTTRTNGQSSSAVSTTTKSAISSIASRKAATAPKPTQSSANGVKPLNGVKTATSKTTTVGIKSATSRLNTGRSATTSLATTKTTTSSIKTTKPNTSSLQSKTGVKPIAVKGKTEAKPVTKSEDNTVETNGSNGASKSMITSLSNKNQLLVQNSLKQELEDAMAFN